MSESTLRRVTRADVQDLARGAAILGTGGGGDPHVGALMAVDAISRAGDVPLVQPDDLPDDAAVFPVAMMGAPTVLVEKLPAHEQFVKAIETLSDFLGRAPTHIACVEAGGVNSTIPIVAAAQLGLPLLDGDYMGRAFPELQMVTATLNQIPASPMSITDALGNSGVFDTVSNEWGERLARAVTVQMGAAAIVSLYSTDGRSARAAMIPGTLSLCVRLGAAVRAARSALADPIERVAEELSGRQVFTGKVRDVARRTTAGFARGEATIEGLGPDRAHTCRLSFQNEYLMAERDSEALVSAPDLIVGLDADTGEPITTEALRFGHRISLVAAPADPRWHTPEGVALVGPRYFGYDTDPVRWDAAT